MITAKEFRNWMTFVEVFERPVRGVELARMLGRAPETISRYRSEGVADTEEKIMRLAMAAIIRDVQPWAAT